MLMQEFIIRFLTVCDVCEQVIFMGNSDKSNMVINTLIIVLLWEILHHLVDPDEI